MKKVKALVIISLSVGVSGEVFALGENWTPVTTINPTTQTIAQYTQALQNMNNNIWYNYNNTSGGSSNAKSLIDIKKITTSGTYNFDADTKFITIYVTGGGGAGGGADKGISKSAGVGGAGGGTWVQSMDITPGSPYSIAIGAGGTGNSAAAGNNGGNTTVSVTDSNGTSVIITGNGGDGGLAGTTSSSDRAYGAEPSANGSSSPDATTLSTIHSAYAIASTPGSNTIYSGSNNTILSGSGGGSYYGPGGRSRWNISSSSDKDGHNAVYPGAGGSGALQTNNNNATGGDGAAGTVLVYEYS